MAQRGCRAFWLATIVWTQAVAAFQLNAARMRQDRTGGLYALPGPAPLAEENDADEHNDGLRNND
jgi:hypothetical protein